MGKMTVKKFDSLKQRDFQNGAVLDEISCALKELESIHGEKEQPPAGLFHGPGLPSKEQPDEWEEWLSRCPTMYLREWFTDMVQILRRKP